MSGCGRCEGGRDHVAQGTNALPATTFIPARMTGYLIPRSFVSGVDMVSDMLKVALDSGAGIPKLDLSNRSGK